MRELIEKRKKYSKMGANMERCVVDVMDQGKSRDAAFAICTASLQKAGQFEPGSNKLTAKGKKASDKAKRKDGMDQKHSEYEAMVKSEGKGTGNMKHLIEQLERLAERSEDGAHSHDLGVGDILYSDWGYDQTNIDFYKVMELRGESTVVIQKVALKVTRPGRGTDEVMPEPGKIVGAKIRKRVSPQGSVKISQYQHASKWDGKPRHQTSAGYGH